MSAAFVLVAICLPVILLSLEADAQPTTDESTSSCGSSMLDDVVNFINTTAFNQRHNSIEIKNEIRDLKNLLELATFSGAEPSKQPLVSTLLCEYYTLFHVLTRWIALDLVMHLVKQNFIKFKFH